MTHAVLRGSPTKAQLYLEEIIKDLVRETGREEDRYCIGKILFKIFRDNPDKIRQIDGTSGVAETNRVVLERSVRIARALQSEGLSTDDAVLVLSKSTLLYTGIFFGSIFAGVPFYLLHYESKPYELAKLLKFKKPSLILVDEEFSELIEVTLRIICMDIKVIALNNKLSKHQNIYEFAAQFDKSFDNFWPVNTDRDTTVIYISSSGSTGRPKVMTLTNRGLTASSTNIWAYEEGFPKPTAICMCVSTPSWITHSFLTISTAIAQAVIMYTTIKCPVQKIHELITKYKPTMTLGSGHHAASIIFYSGNDAADLSCLERVYVGAMPVPHHLYVKFQERLGKRGYVLGAYGMTETHGPCAFARPESEIGSIGQIANCIDYKIVNAAGEALAPNEPGELVLKSDDCLTKGYVDRDEEFKNSFTEDGWFKTGDLVYENEVGDLFYVDRKKFIFKYLSTQVNF